MFRVTIKVYGVTTIISVVASTPFEAIQRAMWDKECYHISKNYNDYKAKRI
jgi:hypothetical protein